MKESYMNIVQHIRAGIYVAILVLIVMTSFRCIGCCQVPEKPREIGNFFPPDLVPHPHLPDPPKHPDTV